jgi:RNA polymerase sigma-70 factor (ECF subfamily)
MFRIAPWRTTKEVGMDESQEIQQLLAAVRSGDEAASAEFYRRFGPFVRAAVRRRLHAGLRPQFDSLDFVQDVWASFLALPADRYAFSSSQALLGFLVRVAQNKVVEVFRKRFGTQKHNGETGFPLSNRDEQSGPASADPTPSQLVIAGEQWEYLLSQVPPSHRAIVERLREGHDNRDIARMTNVSLSTVNRVVRRLKDLAGL